MDPSHQRCRIRGEGGRIAGTLIQEECLLRAVNRTSVRAFVAATGTSRSTVWCVLHDKTLYPFRFPRVYILQPDDRPRCICVFIVVSLPRADPQFSSIVMKQHCYEVMKQPFHEEVFNIHNAHTWFSFEFSGLQ